MNFMEHVAAGLTTTSIIWAAHNRGSLVALFLRSERHLKIHRHNQAGHISHFSKCTEDAHCASLQGMIATQ
jgi:hypothetical protein